MYQVFNILVTGASGQLGSEIRELSSNYEYNFFFTNKDELDITHESRISDFTKQNNINTIINCAAYTAVDKAEDEVEIATKINYHALNNLARVSRDNNIKLVHISTDYVFDGKNYRPYVETDTTNPQSVYGQTKLDGEKELLEINPINSIIIRTSWLYSSFGNNFVKTMLRLANTHDELGVIYDQVGTPTYARDLAKTILDILPIINNKDVEIFNYSNEGVLSWYDFAKEIMKMAKIESTIKPIETKEYPTPATRPHYSLLNKSKIKDYFHIVIPFWKDSLKECLVKLGEKR